MGHYENRVEIGICRGVFIDMLYKGEVTVR